MFPYLLAYCPFKSISNGNSSFPPNMLNGFSNIDFTFASVPELKLPFEPLKEELNMLRHPPFFFFEANAC